MDVTAGEIGWTVVSGVAVATAAHAVGHVVRDHFSPKDGDSAVREEEAVTAHSTEVK